MNYQSIFESLGDTVTSAQKIDIERILNEKLSYEPKIGVFGKTGVGKSSLCNALFGRDICSISDVKACTRDPQEIFLSIGSKGMKLLDVPGVGESQERDKEYAALYKNLLPTLDLVLWVLKGDDRAFSSDEEFYKKLVRPYMKEGMPFLIVINQVDKIEPFREWDVQNNRPAGKQAVNIDAKQRVVADFFELPLAQILTVSANERYHLVELVDASVHSLPKDKKIIFLKEVETPYISDSAKEEAEKGWFDTVVDVVKTVAHKAIDYVVDKISSWMPWNW